MRSHKYNTSMVTDWHYVSGRSQIKYLGHVPNKCKHLFDANLYIGLMRLNAFRLVLSLCLFPMNVVYH